MDINSLKPAKTLLNTEKVNDLQLDLDVEKQNISKNQLIDLKEYNINVNYINIIPLSMAKQYNVIVIDIEDDKLIIAISNPLNFVAIEDIKLYTKMNVKPLRARKEDIIKLVNKHYINVSTKLVLKELDNYNGTNYNNQIKSNELLNIESSPIVRLLNSIIEQAIVEQASDIHIEPIADIIRVRLRINGDLKEIMKLPIENLSAIITRIKIMGQMDIAEKRLSQDGRIETKINNKEIDMRISTLPTIEGEKIVIRLLDKDSLKFTKSSLGFNKSNLKTLNEILRQAYGMILITGPTGSGKTTTLYTILRELNNPEKNIITIEDPVEYKLDGINQVQVNNKSGLNFTNGLRSILRQDPDIIMIGEIRDKDTAEIAIRASITGHLVFSTLHTSNSPSAITRLIDMGVESYLISSAIAGVVSQRLVKVLCNECKEIYEVDHIEKRLLNLDENKEIFFYKAQGCNNCNNGYTGRTAVHEIMPMKKDLKRLLIGENNVESIKKHAIENGMIPLLESAIELGIDGITSYEEIIRIGFTLE